MEGSDSGLQQVRPCQETGGDKITELVAGGTAPEQSLPMAALSVRILAAESSGQGRKGSADPSSGNFTSPFASKGTCVLEFGQDGGFQSASSEKLCECVCVHGRTLEERCVCIALGKEGSCSFNSRALVCPQNLGVFVF